MVNTGTPSNACSQCRTRRVKCDATKPQCIKCVKYGTPCPGYPEKKIEFLNVTDHVKDRAISKYRQKAQQRGSVEAEPHDEEDTSPLKHPDEVVLLGDSDKLPAPIPKNLISKAVVRGAVASFMTQWGMGQPGLLWSAFQTPAILQRTADRSVCLQPVIEAISIMNLDLGNQLPSIETHKPAMRVYGQALVNINRALQDADQRLLDHTLQAVLLIVLYDNLSEDPGQAARVFTHLSGAITLIKLRGPRQFASHTGRILFLTALLFWNQMTVLSPRPMRAPLPRGVWRALFKHDLGANAPIFRLLPVAEVAIELRCTVLEALARPPTIAELYKFLTSIRTVNTLFCIWHSQLPPAWSQKTDFHTVFVTDLYRTHLILLHDLTVRCHWRLSQASSPPSPHTTEIAACVADTARLVDQICASTPYAFGTDDPHARQPLIASTAVPRNGVTLGFHLMFTFPLLVVSMVYTLPQERHDGIAAARLQCWKACGFSRPLRRMPRILLNVATNFAGSFDTAPGEGVG